MTTATVDELATQLLLGDRLALARAITLVENDHADAPRLLEKVYGQVGRAARIGITGPPGAGKSTLTDKLALEARKSGRSVGIVAVDPTSPFTGGALLGDRIRMSAAATDPGVFIRSMATRGALGGIAKNTRYVADLLDASGKDLVFVESVGVGQSELDIFFAVDTVVVMLVPESGSGIQTMKAGLMEIAHCFVVNKADRPGADLLQHEIEDALHLAPPSPWEIKVLLTRAGDGAGVPELFAELERHRRHLAESGELERRRLTQNHHLLRAAVLDHLQMEIFESSPELAGLADQLAAEITAGRLDPLAAAGRLAAAHARRRR